jgi:hypothetical protein
MTSPLSKHGPIRGNVFTQPLPRSGLHNPVVPPLLEADDIENTAPFCCVLGRVYRVVTWQRVHQICYNYNTQVEDPKLNVETVDSTSHVRIAAILASLITKDLKLLRVEGLQFLYGNADFFVKIKKWQ